MRHLTLAALVVAILLGVGMFHGRVTDRWMDPPSKNRPEKGLANLPVEFGDWKGEALPREAEADAKTWMKNCRFTHRVNGNWVLTSITTGRPGRVAIHNPEHCYLGSGYKVVDSIREDSLTLPSGNVARFWTGHFQKKKPAGIESIRIYWGWTADGQWQAPNYPRLFFALKPRLHKLYMIHPVAPGATEDATPYRDFMVRYVDELNRHLGP